MVETCNAGGRRWKPSKYQRIHLQDVCQRNSSRELHVSDETGPEPCSGAGDWIASLITRLYNFQTPYADPEHQPQSTASPTDGWKDRQMPIADNLGPQFSTANFSKFRGTVSKIQRLTTASFPRVVINFLQPLNPTKYAVFVVGNCNCLPNKLVIFQTSSV